MTTKNISKKSSNVAQAERRLAQLQQRQKLANDLRSKGFTGRTDQDVIDAFNEAEEMAEAQRYVNMIYSVPVTGVVIRRWLKARALQNPIFVKGLIDRFLERDGKDGEKDNAEHRRNVSEYRLHLSSRQAA